MYCSREYQASTRLSQQYEKSTSSREDIPYMAYMEVKIPKIKTFHEGMLMLVIEDSAYAQHITIQLGTLHIGRALDLMSEKERTQLSTKWE